MLNEALGLWNVLGYRFITPALFVISKLVESATKIVEAVGQFMSYDTSADKAVIHRPWQIEII